MKETKSKHIDLVQSIITRMAQNSFVIKGWMITIVVGLFLFLQKDNLQNNFLIYLFPIIGFWLLDSYYLWQERLYRKLYGSVISNLKESSDLKLSVEEFKNSTKYLSALFSITEILTYLPVALFVFLILCSKN
ncbi:hypothetical protein GOM48_03435 [Streptococcus oralis]|jgi:hypothetical protein|uniref:hypothetical protein n=1 Tax=Streptococcus TaxID=1301 RepID=UPI00146A0AE3|nr:MULTISPECIES: hypothetical protein [Streptococcus]MBZ2084737.1 hypothetical protein [Streptococcus oralis]MBZ2088486.1 hypothetical protein [Streptococcus oralis]NMD83439.1 hypothetical protein [Streptococcus sp. WB01_FAA12]UJD00026.1 hypothetical protein GOM48_03435 [Streptococcus oralis]